MSKKDFPDQVRKPNTMVHIDSRRMTLSQRKLLNIFVWNYYKNADSKRETYRIPIELVSRYLNETKRNDKRLIETAKRIKELNVEWDLLHDGTRRIGFTSPISEAELIDKGDIKYLEYVIPPKMRILLENRDIYTILNLEVIRLFRCKYSESLYENCRRFLGVGSTGWFTLDLFKKLVGYDGPYTFANFRRFVIDRAVQEVNDLSDIYVEPEYKKQGRRFVAVKFHVTSKLAEIPDNLRKEMFEIINIADSETRGKRIEEFINELKSDPNTSPFLYTVRVQDWLTQARLNFNDDMFPGIKTVLTEEEVSTLVKQAQVCFDGSGRKGACASKWSDFKNRPLHACYHCPKFNKLRSSQDKKLIRHDDGATETR